MCCSKASKGEEERLCAKGEELLKTSGTQTDPRKDVRAESLGETGRVALLKVSLRIGGRPGMQVQCQCPDLRGSISYCARARKIISNVAFHLHETVAAGARFVLHCPLVNGGATEEIGWRGPEL